MQEINFPLFLSQPCAQSSSSSGSVPVGQKSYFKKMEKTKKNLYQFNLF